MAITRTGALTRMVARHIAAERTKRDLSQEQVAERLDTATRNYQRIESGRQNLTLDTIERIAAALGTSGASLLVGLGDEIINVRVGPLERLRAAGYSVTPAGARARKPTRAIEVTTLRAAAGRRGRAGRLREVLGWVDLGRSSSPTGQFIAEVEGESMAPRVPSGSLCLFGPAGPPPHGDRVFLVSLGAHVDDDASASYFLKRIASVRHLDGERTRVVLRSINPSVKPLTIETQTGDDELRVVAELVDVILPGP